MSTIDISRVSTSSVFLEDNMIHGDNYAFYLFDVEGKPAPTYYSQLISSARETVCIWDPYFNTHDTEIFSHLAHPVEVLVLTKKSNQRNIKESYLATLIEKTRNSINSSVKGRCNFFFGFIDTDKHKNELWQCHDRFLIIDKSRFFLVGASIASHRLPNFSTGIYEVKSFKDKKVIEDAFNATIAICRQDKRFELEKI